jgi:hypothetical protein
VLAVVVIDVVQLFVAVDVIDTGVMGRQTVEQLHFDEVPGTASGFPVAGSNGYGQLPSFELHAIAEPGVCQLVQYCNWSPVLPFTVHVGPPQNRL